LGETEDVTEPLGKLRFEDSLRIGFLNVSLRLGVEDPKAVTPLLNVLLLIELAVTFNPTSKDFVGVRSLK